MAIGSKVSGDFKSGSGLFAKVNGGWKRAQFGYVKVNGNWKQFWAAELKDTFSRQDTTNTLGVAESGQAWELKRSQWRINSNNANTTGSKSDYPLATIDTGFSDFNLEANELSPGMGVVFRGLDENNWTAVIPYYNQTSYTYSYCISGHNESYCIAACPDPAGYNLVCEPPNTLLVETNTYVDCVDGYYEPDTVTCVDPIYETRTRTVCTPDRTTTYNCCIKYCNRFGTSICCDRDICTRTIPGDCTSETYSVYVGCGGYDIVYGDFVCTQYGEFTETIETCSPDGFSNVPYYNCCQSGSRFVCDNVGTATAYNQYFYIRVLQMTNGVVSVVSDTQVNERWNAVKISGVNDTISITAYKDSLYTQQVGSVSVTNNLVSTNYGLVGAPSNYEDGRNIGSIQVKAYGQ